MAVVTGAGYFRLIRQFGGEGNLMSLSSTFVRFIEGWSRKADSIDLVDHDLGSYFDKFITLFVIYNRLYAEATFTLLRDGRIKLSKPNANFPDSTAARQYVADFLDGPTMVRSLESLQETRAAIRQMEAILEDPQTFTILSGPRADGSRTRDEALLNKLRSPEPREKAKAILAFVYAIRCNTFHGSKEFDRVQINVLKTCITVISHLNQLLMEKLKQEPGAD